MLSAFDDVKKKTEAGGVRADFIVSDLLAERIRKLVGGSDAGPRSFVVYTGCGRWGRGETLKEAAQAAHKEGAKKTEPARASLVLNDAVPFVDNSGAVNAASAAAIIRLGGVGTVGALLSALD